LAGWVYRHRQSVNIADVFVARGNLSEALKRYEEILEIL